MEGLTVYLDHQSQSGEGEVAVSDQPGAVRDRGVWNPAGDAGPAQEASHHALGRGSRAVGRRAGEPCQPGRTVPPDHLPHPAAELADRDPSPLQCPVRQGERGILRQQAHAIDNGAGRTGDPHPVSYPDVVCPQRVTEHPNAGEAAAPGRPCPQPSACGACPGEEVVPEGGGRARDHRTRHCQVGRRRQHRRRQLPPAERQHGAADLLPLVAGEPVAGSGRRCIHNPQPVCG
jgi:hypothetical protein